MKIGKKLLTGLIIISLLVTGMPMDAVRANEVTVTSLVCEPIEINEKSHGEYVTVSHPETGETVEYYYYSEFIPTFTVTFSDGTTYENQQGGVTHNGQWYWMNIITDQSVENPWEPGIHTATARLQSINEENVIVGEVTTEMTINIVDSPIVSLVCEDVTVIEKTGGYYTTGYDPETFEEIEYYYYYSHSFNPKFTVTFSDGTVYSGTGGFTYEDRYYSTNIVAEQDGFKPWGVGQHKATISIMDYESEFTVNIIKSPIASLKIDDIEIVEQTNGYETSEYDWQTGTYKSYFRYGYTFSKAELTLEDGSTITTNSTYFMYDGQNYNIELSAEQSASNPWGLGAHTVTARFAGLETTYKVNIVESPYASLEILNVAPVVKGENCYWNGECNIYDIPDFSYRVTLEDGTSFVGYYSYRSYMGNREQDSYLKVSSDQAQNPWKEDGNNYFTAKYAGIEVKVAVDFQVPEAAEYYEEDGEIIYLGCKDKVDILEIPSEIDGMPVVAVLGLGKAANTVKEVVIPDSVKMIAESAFDSYQSQIEKITIGSGVTNLVANMFAWHSSLKEIVVSDDNASYCSIDGVVYDKGKTTVVAYPPAKGNRYEVPITVTNVDVMLSHYRHVELAFPEGSTALVKEDGVLYSANKTKIISCDKDKSGEYVMPDTVTEIATGAFGGCTELTSITVSPSVTSISYLAFADCSSLTKVDLPTGLKTIERAAFASCESLETLELPQTLMTIGKKAFESSGIKSIIIPDSVTELGKWAFLNSELSEVSIGSGLKTISSGAFRNTALTSVAIGSNVEMIGEDAFRGTPLESVVFNEKLKVIGDWAFCESPLKEIILPESLETVKSFAFYECQEFKELIIPDSVTKMEEYAFCECISLEEVTVGAGLSVIPKYAFGDCQSLKKAFFKNEGIQVEEGAFVACPLTEINLEQLKGNIGTRSFQGSHLTGVTLSEGVTEVMYSAFENSTSLATIDVPTSLVHMGERAFHGTAWYENQVDGPVYLEHILYAYKGTMPQNTELVVKDGTTVLTDRVFENNTNLSKITLPKGLLTIGDYAFYGTKLKEINIPASVQYIGECALAASDITTLHVDPNNANYSFVDGALYNKDGTELLYCTKQSDGKFTVPKTVEYVAPNAFSSSGVTELIVKNYHTEFADTAFGYEKIPNGSSQGKYLEVKMVCYENSSADVYARKNLMSVEIVELEADEIEIETLPTKVEYEPGEELDTTGLCLAVTYCDGSTEVVSEGFEVSEFDSSTTGTKNVTVTYKGATTEFTVCVKKPIVKSVAIDTKPVKTVYNMGDTIDTDGLKLLITYSNGSTQKVTSGYELGEYMLNSAGKQKITVWYNGVSTSFDVVVKQEGKAIVGSTSGKAGETVEITVSFDKSTNVKSLGIFDLVYDESKLELVSGTWDTEGFLSDWNVEKEEGVLAFTENTEVEQFFTFTFKILEDTQDGDIPIVCRIVGKEKTENEGEIDINITCEVGNITVYSVLPGDVDGNEILNSDDAIYLLYHTMNATEYPINQNCDFNKDGMVNSDDSIYLLYHIMLPETYPLAL